MTEKQHEARLQHMVSRADMEEQHLLIDDERERQGILGEAWHR